MIRKIAGEIIHRHEGEVIVQTGGIGFRIAVPSLSKFPPLGSSVSLWTFLRVREDSLDLFGFLLFEELTLFESMLKVNRLPAKTAMAIIGNCGVQGFRKALAEGDIKSLTSIPGVGKKTAQQLLLELRGQIDFDELPDADEDFSTLDDSTRALIELGYSENIAKQIIRKVREENPELNDNSEIIKLALKKGR
ncbi:MAG: Holliday junction branch migration protein RuvA [Candidatus Hydrogenedentes bacterium CG07_land_8_20_14_0_80_42_17]|nr:MAG: Holliday junction branch migration protein RuvA [Candidatus Hydrogenedentes bacterium CG07_land_8_20_14_0_80_42_17]